MTFKEEFSALEQKSLNQIVATKIHKELSELRARVDASPTIPKRWVWELIQNAKDVNIEGKVRVLIEADPVPRAPSRQFRKIRFGSAAAVRKILLAPRWSRTAHAASSQMLRHDPL